MSQKTEAMASQTTFRLPSVDFSQVVEPGLEAWDVARAQLQRVIFEYGCFEAIYPQVSAEEQEKVLSQMEKPFGLPVETKMKNSGNTIMGFWLPTPIRPLYETWAIEGGDTLESVESFATLMWPQGNPAFSEIITSWAKKVAELSKIIQRMILQILGVEKYYESHLESTVNKVRGSKYKAPDNGTTALAMGGHIDVDMLAIILQSGVNGLEVCYKTGEYHSMAPSSPGNFMVFIGDAFMAWSNGRLHSPRHRVMMSGEKDRFSIGLFAFPKKGWVLKVPDELVDEEHPLLYKPFHYYDYLEVYFKDPVKVSQGLLSEFAGISN